MPVESSDVIFVFTGTERIREAVTVSLYLSLKQ